jgi:EmrB/QacA subfamily drug resistance transporter
MQSAVPAVRDARWISLYVLCTGVLMIVLDTTVVNIALPSIRRDLGFSSSGLAWVINAYLVAFAGLLLISGRLGDLFGGKRVFLSGLALFTVSSLLCGLSTSAAVLIAARFLQGIGGAMTSAVIMAMIVTTFEEQAERTRAIGIFSFTASAGGSIGLLAGGAIAQSFGWHWVFLINIPIGIAVFMVGLRTIVGSRGIGWREGADTLGAVTITAALMAAIYGILQIPSDGFSPRVLAWELGALVAFAAFIWRQRTAPRPLIPLSLFATRNIAITNAVNALVAGAMFTFFFIYTLALRQRGYDAIHTGLAFLPFTLTIGILSVGFAERLTTRLGAKPALTAGLIVATAGMMWLTFAGQRGSYALGVLPAMLLSGAGLGCAFPPMMIFGMWRTDGADAGAASGILNTTSEGGGALGLAALSSLAASAGFATAFAAASGALALAAALAATLATDSRSSS